MENSTGHSCWGDGDKASLVLRGPGCGTATPVPTSGGTMGTARGEKRPGWTERNRRKRGRHIQLCRALLCDLGLPTYLSGPYPII